MAVFCKFYESELIRVFLHAEFISALKTSQSLWVLRNIQKNGIKNIYYHYFSFFVIFSKRFKQKLIIPIESCFLEGKKPNIAKLVDVNFLADNVKNRQAIAFAKIQA